MMKISRMNMEGQRIIAEDHERTFVQRVQRDVDKLVILCNTELCCVVKMVRPASFSAGFC